MTHQLGDDTFMAGDEVRQTGEVAGDSIAAGGDIELDGNVHGDLVAAGGEVEIGGQADDLYVAGGKVRLGGSIAGNARIAGGEVLVRRGASIGGGTSIAGGKVRMEGHVGKYLQITGGDLRIDGTVDGNVEAAGGKLVVGPDANIKGSLTFRGRHPPQVESGAQISGSVKYVPEPSRWKRWAAAAGVMALAWLVGWVVVGAVLLFLWPGFSRAVSQTVSDRPGMSILWGFIVVFLVPVAFALLALTVVGIPLALILLFLYLLLFPLGYLASALAIAEWVLARVRKGAAIATRHRVLALLGVLVVLFIVTSIPVIGGVLATVLVLIGVGGFLLTAVAKHRGNGAARAIA